MDFHSVTRKELQSLCKLNKIPANITNIAMADALQSLDVVQGIEKFINVSQPETFDLTESKENIEVFSPKVPATRCRTTTLQKTKTTESENVHPTGTRTTRRTAKKLTGGVEESNTDVLETPALSSTRRKALATSSVRNVNSQLNDCELDAKEDQKSPVEVVTKSRRKMATISTTLKRESNVQKTYSTRRSTRQTEKKSGESRSTKAIEIISLLDDVDEIPDEVLPVEIPKTTENAGNTNVELEEICNAFEELDVEISEEKEDSCEKFENLKAEVDEISNEHEESVFEEELNDVKPETEDISNPCENGDLESEVIDENSHIETGSSTMDIDDIETSNECLNSDNKINDCSPVDEIANDMKEVSGNMDDALHSEVEKAHGFEDSYTVDTGDLDAKVEVIFNPFEKLDQTAHSHTEEKQENGESDDNLVVNIQNEDIFCAVSEVNEVSENNGSSATMMNNEKILEIPKESLNLDNVNNFVFVDENPKDNKDSSDSEDLKADEETNQNESSSTIFIHVTPNKKNTSIVTDDKENNNKTKKQKEEKDVIRSLQDISMRQLKKQLKALTLKTNNTNNNNNNYKEHQVVASTPRTPLQGLCENQLVGGEM